MLRNIYVRNSLFLSREGPSISCLGPGKGFFPGAFSLPGIQPERVSVYVAFSSETQRYTKVELALTCLQGCLCCCSRSQEVLNPTPLNPTPATCHKQKQKLRCSFRNVALQKLHCNIRFSAMRKPFLPKAALQQAKNCSETLKNCVARKWRFPAAFLQMSRSHV